MKVRPLRQEDTRNEIICDSFVVSDLSSADQLILIYNDYLKRYPDHQVLLTLDDLGQAQYTSAHATLSHDLNDTDGFDLSKVDAEAFEDGEHIGYLSTKSEFFIRKKNFEKMVENATLDEACRRGLTMDEEELEILEKIHHNPFSFVDTEIVVKIVPVEEPAKSICAFPNGYFSCDLSPSENYAVAEYLNERYGYRLFGIGASLLGFIKDRPLNGQDSLALAEDLSRLYNESDVCFKNLVAVANEINLLFLKYSESLEG